MTDFEELIKLAKEQGYIEYNVLIEVLSEQRKIEKDDIEDIIEFLENLSIKVINKP